LLHGYCVRRSEQPGPPAGVTGVGGALVEVVAGGDLAIWLSRGGGGSPTPERLRQHERVVRAALRSATPLPLRYGSLLRTTADAVALLAARREEFAEALERVQDRVEMGLLVSGTGPLPGGAPPPAAAAPPAERTGRAYLELRRDEIRRQDAASSEAAKVLIEIEDELADLGLPTVHTVLSAAPLLGSLAHLVHRADLSSYGERVVELRARRRDLRITPSGPWAPYSFVR
jgi:hypothetical protein